MRFKVCGHKFGHVPFRSQTPGERAARSRSDNNPGQLGAPPGSAIHPRPPLSTTAGQTRPRSGSTSLQKRNAVSSSAAAAQTNADIIASSVVSNPSAQTFSQKLESTAAASLISSLRGTHLPAQLSTSQANLIREKLAAFHPDILTESPFIDVHGKPVEIHLTDADLSSWTDPFWMTQESIPASAKKVLLNIFENYPAHRQWQDDHLEVRTVKKGDVPSDEQELVGQEGVYAKKPIAKGTVVCLFEGVLLEEKDDIETDKKLRKMASCDKYYSKPTRDKIIEGMGRSMKFNAATGSGADERNNLSTQLLQATKKSTQEKIKVIVFRAAKDIQEGGQMCFAYDIRASRP